jgi:hypothetical protein
MTFAAALAFWSVTSYAAAFVAAAVATLAAAWSVVSVEDASPPLPDAFGGALLDGGCALDKAGEVAVVELMVVICCPY